jgi:hypothetical protein
MRGKGKKRHPFRTPTPPAAAKQPSRRLPPCDVPAPPDFDADSDSPPPGFQQRLPRSSYSFPTDSSESEDMRQQHDGNPKRRKAMEYNPCEPRVAVQDTSPPSGRSRLSTYRLAETDDEPSSPSSSLSSAEHQEISEQIRSFAASRVVGTKRVVCKMQANVLRRERYAEQKLLANALQTGDDALLAKALATKVAKKKMPLCAALMGSLDHFKSLANNTKALMGRCGGRHKLEVAYMLIDGLPASFTKSTLGMSATNRRRARQDLAESALGPRGLGSAKYAEGMNAESRHTVSDELDTCYRRFFSRTTHQCSGSNNDKAAIMDTEYHVWGAKLDAQWPGILRELAATSPDCVPNLDAMPKTGWTDFQANLLSAVHGCPDDPAHERKERYRQNLHHYRRHLAQNNGALPRNTDEEDAAIKQKHNKRTASRLKTAAFDPGTYPIHAPTLAAFRKWLDSTELRFTRFSVPHPCPLCEAGPVNEIVYAALNKELVST